MQSVFNEQKQPTHADIKRTDTRITNKHFKAALAGVIRERLEDGLGGKTLIA